MLLCAVYLTLLDLRVDQQGLRAAIEQEPAVHFLTVVWMFKKLQHCLLQLRISALTELDHLGQEVQYPLSFFISRCETLGDVQQGLQLVVSVGDFFGIQKDLEVFARKVLVCFVVPQLIVEG